MATQKGRNWSSGDIVTAANLSSVERGVSSVSSLYEPTTWANGDTVTAAALNNIEQGIVNADGGGQSWVILCEEEVTTEESNGIYGARLTYSQLISADTIKVTFDGTEYICDVNTIQQFYGYGGFTQNGPDFSEYPFAFISTVSPNGSQVANIIYTEVSGTYTVKIEALQESGGSSDFSTAEVTITNNSEMNLYLQSAIIDDDMLMLGTNLFSNSTTNVTFVVYLAGDPCETMILDLEGGTPISSTDISVTGGIEGDGDFFIITGDGTIIISNSSGSSPK